MSRDKRMRVGTFNLYNLVKPGVTYYGNNRYSERLYDLKRRWLSIQLQRMDADIVGFQEAFHRDALKEVIDGTGDYFDAALVTDEREDPDLGPQPSNALVSKYPALDTAVIRDFPANAQIDYDGQAVPLNQFSRPVIRARLRVRSDLEVMVFVAHLKSKRPMIYDGEDRDDPVIEALGKSRSLIRRAAEAVALRSLIVEQTRDTQSPVIVLGDLNDATRAVTTDVIAGSEPWRFLPRERKEKYWDVLLYNAKDILARRSYRDVYYTHIYNGHYESLDHILVSEEWIRANPDHRGDVEYVRVYNDHLVDTTQASDGVPKWQSDHAQIVAEIRLRDV